MVFRCPSTTNGKLIVQDVPKLKHIRAVIVLAQLGFHIMSIAYQAWKPLFMLFVVYMHYCIANMQHPFKTVG